MSKYFFYSKLKTTGNEENYIKYSDNNEFKLWTFLAYSDAMHDACKNANLYFFCFDLFHLFQKVYFSSGLYPCF